MMQRTYSNSFGYLFKKYRLKSEIVTLKQLADLMAEEGCIYDVSIFTRWQNSERIPRQRQILITMLKIFIKRKGMTHVYEANELLESAGHGYLTDREKQYVQII